MPYAQYADRHLVGGAIEGTNHGVNDRVIQQNKEAWKKSLRVYLTMRLLVTLYL